MLILMLIWCWSLLKTRLRQSCSLAKFQKKYSLPFYLKRKSRTGVFLWILKIFSACNFIKNETPAKVLSRAFWNSFQPATLLRTRLWHRCFPMNFTKFLRTPILQNICEGLLLMILTLANSFERFIVNKIGK